MGGLEEGRPLRILVVDESRVLPWLVQRLGGPLVEVRTADSFEGALEIVERGAIDAAVVSLTPARVPWRRFQHACACQVPPVPVLYESCLSGELEELELAPVEGWAAFLAKPATRVELEEALAALLSAAREAALTLQSAV